MEKLEKQAIELLQMMCGSTGCVISDSDLQMSLYYTIYIQERKGQEV